MTDIHFDVLKDDDLIDFTIVSCQVFRIYYEYQVPFFKERRVGSRLALNGQVDRWIELLKKDGGSILQVVNMGRLTILPNEPDLTIGKFEGNE